MDIVPIREGDNLEGLGEMALRLPFDNEIEISEFAEVLCLTVCEKHWGASYFGVRLCDWTGWYPCHLVWSLQKFMRPDKAQIPDNCPFLVFGLARFGRMAERIRTLHEKHGGKEDSEILAEFRAELDKL